MKNIFLISSLFLVRKSLLYDLQGNLAETTTNRIDPIYIT